MIVEKIISKMWSRFLLVCVCLVKGFDERQKECYMHLNSVRDLQELVVKARYLPEEQGLAVLQCSSLDWHMHHFEFEQINKGILKDGNTLILPDNQVFGICAPTICFENDEFGTPRFILPVIPWIERLLRAPVDFVDGRDLSLEIRENIGDLLRLSDNHTEKRVVPYESISDHVSFAILGFPKCGSSSLAYNLKLHPEIGIINSEHPNAGDWERQIFDFGVLYEDDLKKKVYADASLKGRGTDLTIGFKWALGVFDRADVFAAGQSIKTIILIRHPQQYQESVKSYFNQPNHVSLDHKYWRDSVRNNKKPMSEVLTNIVDYFQLDNLMIVSLDNFIISPQATYSAIFNFLNVTDMSHIIIPKHGRPVNVNICKGERKERCDWNEENYREEAKLLEDFAIKYSHGIETIYGLHSHPPENTCESIPQFKISKRELYALREATGPWLICRDDPSFEDANFTNPCLVEEHAGCDDQMMVSIPRSILHHIPRFFRTKFKEK